MPQATHNYIVVSDLHLSEGVDPGSGKYSSREDFLFDREFARFLDYLHGRRGKLPWHLVINGDFVDFLQVTSTTGAPPELLDTFNLKYGLDCGESESVLKLRRIFQGHTHFFSALAHFASLYPVTLVLGNHDIEFFYAGVKEEFIRLLAGCVSNDEAIRKNVSFEDWFFLREELLLVQHGHLYDPLNSFRYALDPRLPRLPRVSRRQEDHIDLPLGSIFVRYFFNRLETRHPFSDNIKPFTRFISWWLRSQPLLALRFFLTDGRYLVDRIGKIWKPLHPSLYAQRAAHHERRADELATHLATESRFSKEEILDRLTRTASLQRPSILRRREGLWTSFLYLLVKLGYGTLLGALLLMLLLLLPGAALLFRMLVNAPLTGFTVLAVLLAILLVMLALHESPARPHSAYGRVAEELHKLWKVPYVVMGHTHQCDLRLLGDGAGEYFNTGTWTRVFEDPPASLLGEENEFAFLEISCEEAAPTARLLRWIDAGKLARKVRLFE